MGLGSSVLRVSVVLLAFASASAACAQEITITFNNASGSPLSYTEQGLTVTSYYPGSGDHVHLSGGKLMNHSGCCSTPYVFTYQGGKPFTVVRVTVTNLTSTENNSWTSSSGAIFKFTANGLVTLPATGWTNITNFRWDATVGDMQIDNLTILVGPVDTTPPAVQVLSPSNGTCTNAGSVNLQVQVTDASATTVGVTGGTSTSLPAGGGTASLSAPLSAEGTNLLTVTATDTAGNSSTATVSVVRDTVAPSVQFQAPSSGAVFGTANVAVSFIVADASETTATFNGSNFSLPAGGGSVSTTYTAPQECAQTVTVTAVDCAGNTGSASVSFIVDLGVPLVTINAPANGAQYGPGSSPLAVTATVDEMCESTVSSNPAGVSGQLPKGGGVVSGSVSLVEGYNQITVSATDLAGHVGSDSVTVLYDTTPPQVDWVSPVENAFLRSTVQFAATAQDPAPGSGVAKVELLDGSNAVPMSFDGTTYTFSVDTTQWPDGARTLAVRATDGVGNSATKSLTVVVDNTPPQVNVTSPGNGTLACESVFLSASAFDATSGLASVTLYANGSPVATFDGAAASFSASVSTVTFPDGPLSLSATAFDHAGNSAASSVVVTVDNTAPAKAFLSPVNGQTVKDTITISANVTDANLATVEFLVDGVSLGVMTSAPFTQTFDTLGVLDGALTIQLVATDKCDNVSTETMTVTVDNLSFVLDPQTLNLSSKGGNLSVTAYVEGKNVGLLIPTEANQIRLALPDGSSVSSTAGFAGDDAAGDYNANGVSDLTIKFDRQALIANLKAAIAAGKVNPNQPVPVKLLAKNGKEIGATTIKVVQK